MDRGEVLVLTCVMQSLLPRRFCFSEGKKEWRSGCVCWSARAAGNASAG